MAQGVTPEAQSEAGGGIVASPTLVPEVVFAPTFTGHAPKLAGDAFLLVVDHDG